MALCEPNQQRRHEVAAQYGVHGYSSCEEAVDSEPITAAIIASPAPHHIPTAQSLVDCGINVLIEKPLSLNLDGIARLTASIRQANVRAAVGFVYRSLPSLQQMRSAIHAGRFGRMVQIQVLSGQHFPFYRPAYRDIYYADPKQGGGLIQDMLPHPMNLVQWIAGAARSVVVDASHELLDGVDVEDTVHILARHGSVLVSYSLNQHQAVNEFVITIHCEKGSVRWELQHQRWLTAAEPGGEWSVEETFHYQRDDYFTFQANAFLDLLDGKAEPLCSLEEGVTTLKSILAIQESRESRRWVTVQE